MQILDVLLTQCQNQSFVSRKLTPSDSEWIISAICKQHYALTLFWTELSSSLTRINVVTDLEFGARYQICLGFPGGASGERPACQCRSYEMRVWSLSREDPLEDSMTTHFIWCDLGHIAYDTDSCTRFKWETNMQVRNLHSMPKDLWLVFK